MKKIIMTIVIVILCSNFVYAAETPSLLKGAEWLIRLSNDAYTYFSNGFRDKIKDIIKGTEQYTQHTAKTLLYLFMVVTILSKVDRFEHFSFITIAPAFMFYGVGLIVVNNVDLIFDGARDLTRTLKAYLGGGQGWISFDVIKEEYLRTSQEIDGRFISLIVDTVNAAIYTTVGLGSVIAIVIVLAFVLIVEMKIAVLRLIAPIMVAGFGSKLTSRFSFSFLQEVFKTHLELFYIKAVMTVFAGLLSDPNNSFIMILIALVGVIIAALGGSQIMFGFLASRT